MPEDSDFIEAMEDVVSRAFSGISTAFPATIVAPLPAQDGLVNIQPSYKFKVPGSPDEIKPNAIQNVPLVYSGRTQGTIIRSPKKINGQDNLIGSKVLCVTCEHSITKWRISGDAVFPDSPRQFDANDCVAILGLYSDFEAWPNPQKPNTFEIAGVEGVKFSIGTQTADLVGLTYQILLLISAGTNPATGALINIATITPLLAKLLTIANPVV